MLWLPAVEQMSSRGSVLDIDLSDLEDAESLPRSALVKQCSSQGERDTMPQAPANLPPPPKTSRSVMEMVANKNPNKMAELLSDAGLGVNRVVAVSPTVPQNQYWMLPGAICDE